MTNENDDSDAKLEESASAQTEDANESNPPESDEQEVAQPSEEAGDALEIALAEAEKFRDLALRSEAEMQNLRKRSERDVQNAHKFGVERLVQNLLPVMDSLEKAIETSEQAQTPEDDPQLEGLRLCLKLFSEVLEKEGIVVVDPLGTPFDPNLHEALSLIENPDLEPNSVMAVIQKGYQLHERLVRPAMVMVSKAPEGA
ncbi:MAG: nucleotide exchange factor GrpE [Pseudomonadales bacterium]|jgi:molecular chaperone GrpE|nr:nucleotide exchange factor GrpE [Pseudomonadales bacterium]